MRAYLALGSNLGDREAYLRQALDAIPDRVDQSSVWETDPVGGPGGQGAFLNMVVALETTRTPRQLLELCQSLETAAGRVRTEHWGPRTLDVDVVLVGDLVVDEPDLKVPHPLWRQRPFVVEPLREVADAALAATLPPPDLTGIRRGPSLWGEFDPSVVPADAARWFDGFAGPWAVAGGWAIEMFVGHSFREHKDLEVAIARHDTDKLHAQLPGWLLFYPSPGAFRPWLADQPFDPDEHQLWCKRVVDGPWTLEILVEDIRDGVLHFRRDPAVTMPLEEAFRVTPEGIPYVAPHLQLLYKTKGRRPRDDADFVAAVPLLSEEEIVWLDEHTP